MDLISWLSGSDNTIAGSAPMRAVLAWKRIQDKPVSIIFRTSTGVLVGAQEVRIESDDRAQLLLGETTTAPRREVVIFGVRDHPDIPDTIISEGYTFVWNNDEYRVHDTILTMGEVQGLAEAIG